MALEFKRSAQIPARREVHGAPTGVCCRVNRFLKRHCIHAHAIANGAVLPDIKGRSGVRGQEQTGIYLGKASIAHGNG